MKYLSNNEIACKKYSNALSIMEALLDDDYVVMLSKEEKLYIINYEWSPSHANRNDVVFISREEFEDEYFKIEEEE